MRARQIWLHYRTRAKLRRLKKSAEAEGAYRVAKRLHAVLLNSEARTSGEIARILDAPLSKVSQWLLNYEQYGYEGLLEGHRCGRPPGLSSERQLRLADIIDSGPVAYGYLSGVWTSPMLARVIAEEFDRQYHPGHVRKLLAEIGFSVQRPKRLLARADPAQQDQWHRYTYPNLKKNPRRKSGANFRGRSQLSSRFHLVPNLGPPGMSAFDSRHRPEKDHQDLWCRRGLYGTLPLSPHHRLQCHHLFRLSGTVSSKILSAEDPLNSGQRLLPQGWMGLGLVR